MPVKGKKYIRRPIKNATDLEREQERIRMKYKKIEARMLFTLFGSAAASLAGSLRKSSRRKKKKNGSAAAPKHRSFFGKLLLFLKKPAVVFLMKVWFRWQLFHFVYRGIKKMSRSKSQLEHISQ